MSLFKEHQVSTSWLLGVIPDALLTYPSEHTKVDYYSKVLHGEKLFYLLMYGILENDRLSQRTLEDTFNDTVFKTLFNLDRPESVRHSSVSERLSKIDSDYSKQIYEPFSAACSSTEHGKHNLIRVDSSMVSEACGKLLVEGIDHKNGKKSAKYSVAFDGILPCGAKVFTLSKHSNEDIALPEVPHSFISIILK